MKVAYITERRTSDISNEGAELVKEVLRMVLMKSKKLKTDVECPMQFIAATSRFVEKGVSRYIYNFFIRVWPDKNDLSVFYDVVDRLCSIGKDSKELVALVEKATGYEFDANAGNVEFVEGAVFKGVIKTEVRYGTLGRDEFYSIVPVKHYGYCEIEGGVDYNLSKLIERYRKK